MKFTRGKEFGILVVGDSLPPNKKTTNKLNTVLDPKHPVYNSLIVPIKYYLNNYLNSQGYQLPEEKVGDDFFFYINAVDDPKTKSNPDLRRLKTEVQRPEHKVILSLGNFAFWAVEDCFKRKTKKTNSIPDLGKIFLNNINKKDLDFPIHLPVLHNVANLKFERTIEFLPYKSRRNYISYFHYVGIQLGKLLLTNRDEFTPILRRGV